MYKVINSLIQFLLRALEIYEEKVREGELSSINRERRKLEEEMANAKSAEELVVVINNWSDDELLSSDTDKDKKASMDDST